MDNFRFREDNKNVPLWAIAFYALRCGLDQDLIKYLEEYDGTMIDVDLLR